MIRGATDLMAALERKYTLPPPPKKEKYILYKAVYVIIVSLQTIY